MMKRALGYFFVLCGAAAVALCFYFEKTKQLERVTRKPLPDKRKNGNETNNLQKELLPYYEIAPATPVVDPQFREALIINEIETAEKLMALDKWDEAILHFAHAISVCADPGHLLNCLRQTLPPPSYHMLMQLLIKEFDEPAASSSDGMLELGSLS